jgi:hypothetical protein
MFSNISKLILKSVLPIRKGEGTCTPGHTAARDGCTPASHDPPEDGLPSEEVDLNEVLEDDLGMSLDRKDVRELGSLKKADTLKKLSSKRKPVEKIKIKDLTGLDMIEDVEPIEDPDSVPPIIVGYDGELIDGHHRLSGMITAGVTHARAVVASEEDLKAARELGGLQGRGSWPEEFWVKWMLSRSRLRE